MVPKLENVRSQMKIKDENERRRMQERISRLKKERQMPRTPFGTCVAFHCCRICHLQRRMVAIFKICNPLIFRCEICVDTGTSC